MRIAGPIFDSQRRTSPKKWFLRYFSPERNSDGSLKLGANGKPVKKKHRPYYESKELAIADKERLRAQYAVAGIAFGAEGVLSRSQVEDYELARREVSEVPLAEIARFWRLHHPRKATKTVREQAGAFLSWVEARVGATRHHSDLKSRLKTFCVRFGDRLPATVTRAEFLAWLLSLGKRGRTVLNHKRAVVNFFNWLATQQAVTVNPFAGIKKRELPREDRKEIGFLGLVEANRYLRAAERYDPNLVAHETIQFFAGVRADDEMADFDGAWVKAQTKEVVIPAGAGKIAGRRDVIAGLEDNFWLWWAAYGRDGLLRPRNYRQRWLRVRALAAVEERAAADELARLPIKTLLARAASQSALGAWPWNARRRTFCTYHVAKHQSADRTALILRHRGAAATLHNSYRGTGATQEQGAAYFALGPNPVARPILPARPARGIVRLQGQR